MGYRLILLLTSFYFILNMIAGTVLHCATRSNCTASPSVLETVVYFAVFGFFGIPLVMGTVMWQSRWHADL